jgi:uncharacterized protein (TIGR02145 family)
MKSIKELHRFRMLLPVFIALMIIFAGCESPPDTHTWDIQNPYEAVDWENDEFHKANLHTHTTKSDGNLAPHTVVDEYHKRGYTVLAIADHNAVTYPWTEFSRMAPWGRYAVRAQRLVEAGQIDPDELIYEDQNPDELGMISIPGNEISNHNHMVSLFNDYEGEFGRVESHTGAGNEEVSMKAVAEKGGLLFWAHPYRFRERNKVELLTDDLHGWFVDKYERYDNVIGQEINARRDRMFWDRILTRTMPDRPVWGFTTDDMHVLAGLGLRWSVLILPEFTKEAVRRSIEEGRFFSVITTDGHDGPEPPVIKSISVDRLAGTISIQATGYESMKWVSNGEIVHTDNVVDLNELENLGSYIRATFFGEGGTYIMTQPFGIRFPAGVISPVADRELELSIEQGGGVTDIEGNEYETMIIGDQHWMAENLRVTRYRDGTLIDSPGEDYDAWRYNKTGAYSWYNADKEQYANAYGALYNWYATDNDAGLCPEGWRMPTDDDFKILEMYLGMKYDEANAGGWRGSGSEVVNRLKSTRTEADGHPFWAEGLNDRATNESGFSFIPGGLRTSTGYFVSLGRAGYLWSSTERNPEVVWARKMELDYDDVTRFALNKDLGFNVRCIKQ